ncbi:MAG TPA: hypothetical protein VGX91_01045 [Candidatus Cybelea sp.]|jgi:hypothetical protein|nr:hypothetical protein [Candidatus Cybelea sp.]
MQANRHLIQLAAALTTLALGVVACQGAPTSSAGYVPPGASNLAAPQANGAGAALPDKKHRRDEIISSCGDHLRIVLLGVVDCKFREKRQDAKFTISDRTHGIVVVSPSKGTSGTTFTILGAIVGSAAFTVKDARGNRIVMRVKVTL